MWFHLSIAVSLKFPVFTVLFKQMKIITTQNLYCVLTTTNKNCGWIYADTDFSSSTIFAQLWQYFKRKLRNIYLQAGARDWNVIWQKQTRMDLFDGAQSVFTDENNYWLQID